MDEALDQEVQELLNDASHAWNGPRSEEVSMNYLHGEEFKLRLHEILSSMIQICYGEDDCNVMFKCNSDGEAMHTGNDVCVKEIFKNFSEEHLQGTMVVLPAI